MGIAKYNQIGVPGQLPPKVAMILVILTLPASIGSWVYPIYELIAGDLPWWKTISGVAVGVVCASWIPRLLSSSFNGVLLSNPLAVILSIVGVVILIVSHWS